MMLITAAIAVPVSYSTRFNFCIGTRDGGGRAQSRLRLFLVYQIGFVDGLFAR